MQRLLAFLAVASLALVGAGASSAAPVLIAHVPFSFIDVSHCTGETIQFEGTLTLILQDFTDESGQLHSLRNIKVQGKGVGTTTGTIYVIQSSFTETITRSTAPGAEVIGHNADITLVNSQGSESNEILQTFFEAVIVDGELKVSRFDFNLKCT